MGATAGGAGAFRCGRVRTGGSAQGLFWREHVGRLGKVRMAAVRRFVPDSLDTARIVRLFTQRQLHST